MKVSELEIGMMIKPAGDNEVLIIGQWPTGSNMYYVMVGIQNRLPSQQKAKSKTNRAVYLGDRKAINMPRTRVSWSNRFVLIDGIVAAVDPTSWRRIKKACL